MHWSFVFDANPLYRILRNHFVLLLIDSSSRNGIVWIGDETTKLPDDRSDEIYKIEN